MAETTTKTILYHGSPLLQEALFPVFYKEGWQFCALGTGPESLQAANPAFHGYDCTPGSEAMRQLFAVHHFQLLVWDLRQAGSAEALTALEEVLHLARQQGTDQVLLLSSADVYPPGTREAAEDRIPGAVDGKGQLLQHLEALGRSWRQQGLAVTVLRFPDLYGEDGTLEEGFLDGYLSAWIRQEALPAYPAGEVRDFLCVRDAAYAVLQTSERKFRGEVLHFGSGKPLSYEAFQELVARSLPNRPPQGQQEDHFAQAVLAFGLARREIGWKPRYQLADQLEALCRKQQEKLAGVAAESARQKAAAAWKRRWKRWLPYGENVLGALFMLGIQHLQQGRPVNAVVALDFNFLYIAVMGLVYGRRQALLAVVLAYLTLIISSGGQVGAGLITILYRPEELLHYLAYLVTGIFSGYFADRARFRQNAAEWQHRQDLEQYRFLHRLFAENVKVKDQMYRQIVNSRDSLGHLYYITRSLDSVEPENVFNKTALITADLLDVSQVIIYVASQTGEYLRQKVRLGNATGGEPRSLKISEHPYLQRMMKDHGIFVNRDLLDGVPDLAAPIVYKDRVIAVIQIYQLDFERWNVAEINLLAVTSRMVASALGRAYEWEEEMVQRRYLPHTRILKESEFFHVIEKIRERRHIQQDYPVMLLKVDLPDMDYEQIDRRIGTRVRAEDYLGIIDGAVWILFADVDQALLPQLRKRLAQGGIPTSESREVV